MLTLTFSDTELCSLLSNALENAMCACKIIADRDKGLISLRMSLRLYSKNNKLCIKLRNRYEVKPVFHEGLFPYPKNRGMASVRKARRLYLLYPIPPPLTSVRTEGRGVATERPLLSSLARMKPWNTS